MNKGANTMLNPTCPYCGKLSELVKGNVIYSGRRDLWDKTFYLCAPCDAYVGCHPNSVNPLGRLANEELRKAKMLAHRAFDPMWRDGNLNRRTAYCWLAERLGIEEKECHIGMFDVDMCKKVIQVCKEYLNHA